MTQQFIEIYYHNGEGYNPFFIKDNWQVAQLNYLPILDFTNIDKLEKHEQTDEIFILFKGTAILIAADVQETDIGYQCINMKQGITYNIPTNRWHAIAMSKDAEIIIVEKSNTHLNDVFYKALSADEKSELEKQIQNSLNPKA